MRITTSAGHSYACDGAQGCGYSEHAEAVKLNDAFIALCREHGVEVSDSTSEASTQAAYLAEQARKANASGADLAIQWHFNAYNGSAHGTECLYYDARETARKVSAAIASLGFLDRGPKQRTDLYWLSQTRMSAILIETCFIDNCDDMALYAANVERIAEAVFEAVTGIEVREKEETKVDCCIQCEPNLTDSQLWKIEDAGDGLVRLRCKRGGMLDVIGGTDKGPMENFRDVWTHQQNGTPAQSWRLLDGVDENSFMLASSIDEGYVLDAVHGPVGERGYVQMHRRQSKAVDQWAQSWRTIPWHGGGGWVGIVNAKSWMVLDANPTSISL